MIKISNEEAKELREMGVNDGENGISHSHNKTRHYFLCESKFNLSKLNIIRNRKIK